MAQRPVRFKTQEEWEAFENSGKIPSRVATWPLAVYLAGLLAFGALRAWSIWPS